MIKIIFFSHDQNYILLTWSKLYFSHMIKIIFFSHDQNYIFLTWSKLYFSHMIKIIFFSHDQNYIFSHMIKMHNGKFTVTSLKNRFSRCLDSLDYLTWKDSTPKMTGPPENPFSIDRIVFLF
jgi:hypothetical protein